MKKHLMVLSFIAVAMSSTLSGCKKDKTEVGTIVGKWEGVSYSDRSFIDGQLEDTDQGTFKAGEYFVDFKSNKTVSLQYVDMDDTDNSDDSENLSGTYTLTGNKIQITIVGIDDIGEGEFSLTNNNNTLTITYTYEERADGKVFKEVLTEVYKRM